MQDLEARVGDLFRPGHASAYEARVSGGSSTVRYYAAGGTELQGGAEPNNDFRHTSGRANLTVTPSDQVTLSANVGYVTGPTHLSAEAGFGGRVWTTVLATPRTRARSGRALGAVIPPSTTKGTTYGGVGPIKGNLPTPTPPAHAFHPRS